jgi:glycosyltransferase involved in cell wall biosynthesis
MVIVPHEFAHLHELRKVREVLTLPFRRDYRHPLDELRVVARLTQVLRGTALVHAHAAKAGVLARVAATLTRQPAVYTPHGFPFVGEMSVFRRRFGLVVERALATSTDALVCVCEFERTLASEQRLRPRRAAVVHNGCPPCPNSDRAKIPQGLIVGTVSTLRPAKALDCLLDAMPSIVSDVPEARLVIVGEGPLKAALQAQAANLGLDVMWLPFRPPAARYLRGFDVFVLSSAWEAFPIGVLEAQACGVPQVVTAVGGTPEAVVPETGIVVPPRDPAALARAVTQLLRDPQRRAAMSEASRARHAERFTVECMVQRTAAVYDRVLSGVAGPAYRREPAEL